MSFVLPVLVILTAASFRLYDERLSGAHQALAVAHDPAQVGISIGLEVVDPRPWPKIPKLSPPTRVGPSPRGERREQSPTDRRTSMLRSHGKPSAFLGAAVLLMSQLILTRAEAQTPAPGSGGHATVLNVFYPEVWDPHIAGTIGPLAAFSPLYNQIVEFNPLKPTEITGDLAKRWDVSSNGLIFTFYLHENVKWWDDKDLTAEDVVFSLKRMIEPGKPRPRVGL
jgi:hypothetical protein